MYIYFAFLKLLLINFVLKKKTASRCIPQDSQREPSVKTLLSPVSTEFWRHCVAELNAALCLDTRAKKWNGMGMGINPTTTIKNKAITK